MALHGHPMVAPSSAFVSALPLTVPIRQPGTQSSSSQLRGRQVRASASTPQAASGFQMAANAAGMAVAAAAMASSRGKTCRHFFGDDSGGSAVKRFDPADQLGVQDPIGFWDPLGFSDDKDEATFKRRRAVEIKHGRISMYATIGYIVPEYFKFPGYLSPSLGLKFADVPNGLAALSKVPVFGGAQIIAFAGLIETTGFFQAESTTGGRGPREGAFSMSDSTETGEPGNYGVGFPNFLGKVEDPEARKSKLAAELANGRLAMVAIIGMFFQDGLTGSAWGDWALYTASPLRATAAAEVEGAVEKEVAPPPPPPFDPRCEIGVMPPLDYFDPAGFAKKGDKEGFRNFRAAELKHGRVAMMAALGDVVQHYVKLPGFEKMPDGMKAAITAPGSYGMVALFLVAGALELTAWSQDPEKEVGDFGDPLGLGQYDIDMRNRELNNGRFAMFAALGIVVADLYTGNDGIVQLGLDYAWQETYKVR